jgi:Rrf2 family protein
MGMLTKTSETAIRMLILLARRSGEAPLSPRQIAETLDSSPTYTAKTAALLAKAGLLRSHRGAQGGVTLALPPAEISLLAIVEACQGRILGDYCQPADRLELVCAYHEAMHHVHEAVLGVLRRYTLAELVARPGPHGALVGAVRCRMQG